MPANLLELEKVAGIFPKQCAVCKRTFTKIEFKLLEFKGVMGMKVKDQMWKLELRDCPCTNTLSNLEIT
jgi:hypothetical protein